MSKLQSLFLPLFVAFLIHPADFAKAQLNSLSGEGFDVESPEQIEKARKEIEDLFKDAIEPHQIHPKEKLEILSNYSHLDPKNEVPTNLLEQAILYFEKNKSRFPNQSHITIVDYAPRSNEPRMFVVDLFNGHVSKYYTAHGIGSDAEDDGYAESFGNVPNSGKSSLGFVRTGEVYWGKYNRSIRLDGLSSTNSKIRQRAIVLHGWNYVWERPVIQGLSWGCPALDWTVKDSVIDRVKEGSLMYMGLSRAVYKP